MQLSTIFLLLGLFFLFGLLADEIGRRTRLPRVTILLMCGLIVGQSGFGLIPLELEVWFEFLSITALTMVSFLLGSSLTGKSLALHGRVILSVSVAVVLVTMVMVWLGLWLLGVDPALALVLGAIASATDPAATSDALKQAGVRGGFADTLRGIVAIDDAWGLIAFSLVMVVANSIVGTSDFSSLATGLWEIFGALGLAAAIGFPAAYLTGRVRSGEPLAAEALGIVFLSTGLALWLDVSFLLVGMTVGAIVANVAVHHQRAFHEIDRIQWPFMILFFILAGASFDLNALIGLGWVGVAFLVLRFAARFIGGAVGARIGRAPRRQQPWFGIAMLPQAGVAIGMALVAMEALPEHARTILTLAVCSTIVYELIGPVATIYAARRASDPEERKATGATRPKG